VVVFTGLSQKNAVRLQHDGAYAFLEKSELALDKGCEKFADGGGEDCARSGLAGPRADGSAGSGRGIVVSFL
jgi:hypothetical protein